MRRTQTQNTIYSIYETKNCWRYYIYSSRDNYSLLPEETATLHFTQHYAKGLSKTNELKWNTKQKYIILANTNIKRCGLYMDNMIKLEHWEKNHKSIK